MATINQWQYKNMHVPDASVNTDSLLTAGRCVIYAQVSDDSNPGEGHFQPIGIIQAFSWAEQRQVELIFELGSEVPYLIPGRTTGQIGITRMLLHGKDLANVIYGSASNGEVIKSLKDINKPLNLLFASFGSNYEENQQVFSRLFLNCWIVSRNESVGAGQTVIAENCNLLYEDIPNVEVTTV